MSTGRPVRPTTGRSGSSPSRRRASRPVRAPAPQGSEVDGQVVDAVALVEAGPSPPDPGAVAQLHRLAEEQVTREPRLVGGAIHLAEDVPVDDVRDTRLPARGGKQRRLSVSLAQLHHDVGSAQECRRGSPAALAHRTRQPGLLDHLRCGPEPTTPRMRTSKASRSSASACVVIPRSVPPMPSELRGEDDGRHGLGRHAGRSGARRRRRADSSA